MDVTQLDAVSLIMGALAAGAGDGLKDVVKGTVAGTAHSAGQHLQAARQKLIDLIRDRFGEDEDAVADLGVYLRRPSSENAEVLSGHILATGIDEDPEVLAAAREFLGEAGPTALGPGSIAARTIKSINKGPGHSHIGGVQNYGAPPDPH